MGNKKQFVVIGLGRFGITVAKTLYSLGHDVLALDNDEDKVQEIADYVTHSAQVDATDENALKNLGIRNFDVAVVTIGGNIQGSVMATLLVKELGIEYIVAKAHNDLHAKVLNKIGADRVVLPEKDMGIRVAHNLVSASILDYIELSPDHSIMELKVLRDWIGKNLTQLGLRSVHNINAIAIKRENNINISPINKEPLRKDDIIIAIGYNEDLKRLEELVINEK